MIQHGGLILRTFRNKLIGTLQMILLLLQKMAILLKYRLVRQKLPPLLFWKLALRKKFSRGVFNPFGDGQAMVANRSYYIERLTKTTYGPVMIDGSKAGQLEKAYKEHIVFKDQERIFNVMGHPKSLSNYSLAKLESFIKRHPEISSITYQDLQHLKNNNG